MVSRLIRKRKKNVDLILKIKRKKNEEKKTEKKARKKSEKKNVIKFCICSFV